MSYRIRKESVLRISGCGLYALRKLSLLLTIRLRGRLGLRDLLLDGPTGKKILEKVLDIALNDEHQGQMAAMKLCVDRILPMSYFDNAKDAPRSAIQINITDLGEKKDEGTVIDV
jgi:hypothetical protein